MADLALNRFVHENTLKQAQRMDRPKPKATLLLTRLDFADWNDECVDLFEWAVQRWIFLKHDTGVDSHLAIRFSHRTHAMMAEAKTAPFGNSRLAANSENVIWEVVQTNHYNENKSGFRAENDSWVCDWQAPTVYEYTFNVTDADFVTRMHTACVNLIANRFHYAHNARYNATLCRCWPQVCCEPPGGVNCVTAVLIVIAHGIDTQTTLAPYSDSKARKLLKLNSILEAHTPYAAYKALVASKFVSNAKAIVFDTFGVEQLCRIGASPCPALMLRL